MRITLLSALAWMTLILSTSTAWAQSKAPIDCRSPDRDLDGHKAIRCGGDDCDDQDAQRHPGRVEVCDQAGHDEDCNLETPGTLDWDRDGFVAKECKNLDEKNQIVSQGDDYDDRKIALRPGAQICIDDQTVGVLEMLAQVSPYPCQSPMACVRQPNRTGVCVPR